MPSDPDQSIDSRSSEFEGLQSVEWSQIEASRSTRWSGVSRLGVVGLVVGLAILDSFVLETGLPLPSSLTPDRFDWLLVASLVGIVVLWWPVIRDRDRLTTLVARYPLDSPSLLGLAIVTIVIAVGVLGPFVVPEPAESFDRIHQPPLFVAVEERLVTSCLGEQSGGYCHGTTEHPFGTDRWGQDILSYVVHSTRTTLEMIALVAVIAVPIATIVGTVAAYAGDPLDSLLMRYVDVQMVVPAFFVYFVLYFTYGPSHAMLVAVFGCFSWGGIARAVRLEVVRVRREQYVTAAKAAGAGTIDRIVRHVLPNVAGVIVVAMTIQVPFLIVAEASLSFLGLGDAAVYSWGDSIRRSLENVHLRPWIPVVPGLALSITVLGWYLLGDALQDAFDPYDGRTRR